MNAKQLLAHIESGARLRTRWSYGQRFNKLTLISGESLDVQYSNIAALLKKGTLYSLNVDVEGVYYYLPGQHWSEAFKK